MVHETRSVRNGTPHEIVASRDCYSTRYLYEVLLQHLLREFLRFEATEQNRMTKLRRSFIAAEQLAKCKLNLERKLNLAVSEIRDSLDLSESKFPGKQVEPGIRVSTRGNRGFGYRMVPDLVVLVNILCSELRPASVVGMIFLTRTTSGKPYEGGRWPLTEIREVREPNQVRDWKNI